MGLEKRSLQIFQTTLLCLWTMKPYIIGLVHFSKICSHVSFSFELQILQLELEYLVGQKRFLRILSIYCPMRNSSSCLICASII